MRAGFLHWWLHAAITNEELMKALLLENIHPEGVRLLTERGIEVETVKGALDEDELIAALHGVQLLGIRSKTNVTAERARGRAGPAGVGAFCIGTNQVDLHRRRERGDARLQRAVLQHPQRRRAGRSPRSSRWRGSSPRRTRRCTPASGTSRPRAPTRSAAARSASSATATSAASCRSSPRRSACGSTSTTSPTSSRSATPDAARRSTSCWRLPRR